MSLWIYKKKYTTLLAESRWYVGQAQFSHFAKGHMVGRSTTTAFLAIYNSRKVQAFAQTLGRNTPSSISPCKEENLLSTVNETFDLQKCFVFAHVSYPGTEFRAASDITHL